MSGVDVGVAHCMHEFASVEAADLREHAGEEGVGGYVEWNSETHIGRALVELAGESVHIVYVELAEQVARRQCHLVDVGCVPG